MRKLILVDWVTNWETLDTFCDRKKDFFVPLHRSAEELLRDHDISFTDPRIGWEDVHYEAFAFVSRFLREKQNEDSRLVIPCFDNLLVHEMKYFSLTVGKIRRYSKDASEVCYFSENSEKGDPLLSVARWCCEALELPFRVME